MMVTMVTVSHICEALHRSKMHHFITSSDSYLGGRQGKNCFLFLCLFPLLSLPSLLAFLSLLSLLEDEETKAAKGLPKVVG